MIFGLTKTSGILLKRYILSYVRYTGTELNRIRPSNPRSQRFSRHRNRDRIYQGRHTVERDRGIDRFPRRFELMHFVSNEKFISLFFFFLKTRRFSGQTSISKNKNQ